MKGFAIKVSVLAFGLFFIIAGINHFVMPHIYVELIPDYIPFHKLVNIVSGVLEIVLGLGVLIAKFRSKAAIGIFVLLLTFIPAHVYFIQIGSCLPNGICVPEWISWLRLVLIHPILLFWSIFVSKQGNLYVK